MSKSKEYQCRMSYTPAFHTLTTTEYTHDDFSRATKKKKHVLFTANSFQNLQNLQNKKKGGLHPLEKTLFYFFHIFRFCHVHVFLPNISLVTISNRCHVIDFEPLVYGKQSAIK